MALAIDASSPAAVTATTTSKATASFTPPANSLIVAMAVAGDTNGTGSDTGTVTDSLSSTWTLKKRINTAGDGSAQIYMMDAGASPAARTVTVTGTDSGVQLAVLVFTGAAVTASQTGANTSASSTTFAISVTPTATGSYLVGCLCQSASGLALTINGNSTNLLATNDASNGETYGSFRSTSTTASLSAVSVGYTNTGGTAVQICAVEVLASTTTSTPISNGDTGSGADAGSVAARLSAAETGSGADAASLVVTTSSADTGSGTETASIAFSDGDSGTFTDSASVGVPISASDSGTFTDAVAALSATLTASDAGTGADGSLLLRPASDGDTGTGTDAVVRISLTDGDTGTAVDTAAVSNAVVGAETGSFTDTASKGFGTSETGTVTDAGSLVATFQNGEAGTFADRVVSIVKTGQFFRPPTVTERFRFAGRTTRTQTVGVTILKKSGSYTSITDPTAEQVTAADIAYLGGRDYLIDDTEKAALIAAGYGSYIVSLTIP